MISTSTLLFDGTSLWFRCLRVVATRVLKHKGHEGPRRGPQSIAFESGISVPGRRTTLWTDGRGFNVRLKRKERYDRDGSIIDVSPF